jgi:hypothetical protein
LELLTSTTDCVGTLDIDRRSDELGRDNAYAQFVL